MLISKICNYRPSLMIGQSNVGAVANVSHVTFRNYHVIQVYVG